MQGLLLFAHGARDPAWARPFERIAAQIAGARPELPLALAYLELMQPDIESAAESLCARGCTEIHIVPMFLGASGHVRRDVPPLVEQLQARHAGRCRFHLHEAIGEQASVIEAMASTALAFLPLSTPTP